MATLSQLQARLEQIKEARDSGVLSSTYEGRTTTFRSLEEMNSVIATLENQIAGLTSPSPACPKPDRQIRVIHGGKDL